LYASLLTLEFHKVVHQHSKGVEGLCREIIKQKLLKKKSASVCQRYTTLTVHISPTAESRRTGIFQFAFPQFQG